MWQDMGTYWALRGSGPATPPTVKRLDYVQLKYQKLCIGVWDDDVYTPLNRDELKWHYDQATA